MKYTQLVTCISTFILASTTHADAVIPSNPGLPGGNVDGITGVTGVMSKIIERGLDITLMMAVVGICVSGYMFMTTGGNEEKYKKALKYSGVIAVGILISASAFGIVALINKIPTIL